MLPNTPTSRLHANPISGLTLLNNRVLIYIKKNRVRKRATEWGNDTLLGTKKQLIDVIVAADRWDVSAECSPDGGVIPLRNSAETLLEGIVLLLLVALRPSTPDEHYPLDFIELSRDNPRINQTPHQSSRCRHLKLSPSAHRRQSHSH